MARETPRELDAWALHWLWRWISKTPATIERGAEITAQLADLPSEPSMFETLPAALRQRMP